MDKGFSQFQKHGFCSIPLFQMMIEDIFSVCLLRTCLKAIGHAMRFVLIFAGLDFRHVVVLQVKL